MNVDDHRNVALRRAVRNQFHDFHRRLGVERGRRFVREEEVRLLHQGTRNADALALSAGELIGALCGKGTQSDGIEQLKGAFDVGCRKIDAAMCARAVRSRAVRIERFRSRKGVRRGCTPGKPCRSCRRAKRNSGRDKRMMSRPRNMISPAVGSTRRLMQRISVDFPVPDGPMTAVIP